MVSQIPIDPKGFQPGRTECALNKPLIKIVLWAYSVRPYTRFYVGGQTITKESSSKGLEGGRRLSAPIPEGRSSGRMNHLS